MSYTLALMPSGPQWIVIAAIGLLLFGKRLPEVGRSLGKGIVEFKKGLSGVAEEVRQVDTTPAAPAPAAAPAQLAATTPAAQPMLAQQAAQPAAPVDATAAAPKTQFKFDPYTGKPIENSATPQT